MDKRYVIKKRITASSMEEAIKKDSSTSVEECWIDTDYKEDNKIGF